MVDILHRIGVTSSPDDVYAALTTVDGLASWWTEDTDGDGNVGGVIRFRFGPGGFDMKVLEAEPAELVRWEVVDGPEEWIGTQIRFELKQEDGDQPRWRVGPALCRAGPALLARPLQPDGELAEEPLGHEVGLCAR